MAEIKEVTKGKLYVLYYDCAAEDYDTIEEDLLRQVYEALPEGSTLLALPEYYNLQEESTDNLLEIKATIESILESRQNNS